MGFVSVFNISGYTTSLGGGGGGGGEIMYCVFHLLDCCLPCLCKGFHYLWNLGESCRVWSENLLKLLHPSTQFCFLFSNRSTRIALWFVHLTISSGFLGHRKDSLHAFQFRCGLHLFVSISQHFFVCHFGLLSSLLCLYLCIAV